MAKNKKNKDMEQAMPNIPALLSETDIAQNTVERMQGVLTSLGSKSEEFNRPAPELFQALQDMGVEINTTVEVYAALKQAYLTTIFVIENSEDPANLATNMFSLLLGNAMFWKQVGTQVPEDKLNDVVIMVTNLMFQLEAGTEEQDDDSGEQAE